jgi:transcriptional regulator with XRE-family HTH domain
MKAKNLSRGVLAKQAGLEAYVISNILRGKTKRPKGDVLQAIADVFGCSVRDLLTENQGVFKENDVTASKDDILGSPYKHLDLLKETIKIVNDRIEARKQDLTVQQALRLVQETYLHSLQKKPEKVDPNFVEWFIGLIDE